VFQDFNEDVITDAYDGTQRWATNQIQWLIKKGDVVNPSLPLFKSMEIRLSSNETTRAWNTEFVVSHNEPGFLPRSLKHGEFGFDVEYV
jgi:hypothetical protein